MPRKQIEDTPVEQFNARATDGRRFVVQVWQHRMRTWSDATMDWTDWSAAFNWYQADGMEFTLDADGTLVSAEAPTLRLTRE